MCKEVCNVADTTPSDMVQVLRDIWVLIIKKNTAGASSTVFVSKKVALIQYFMVCPASGFNTHHKSVYHGGFGDLTATRCEGFSS
jgi:hypothetical protein